MTDIYDHRLTDAQYVHARFPEHCQVPSHIELTMLKVGDQVQLCFYSEEHLWVRVLRILEDGIVEGEVESIPTAVPVEYGDIVHFERRHVYQILKEKADA